MWQEMELVQNRLQQNIHRLVVLKGYDMKTRVYVCYYCAVQWRGMIQLQQVECSRLSEFLSSWGGGEAKLWGLKPVAGFCRFMSTADATFRCRKWSTGHDDKRCTVAAIRIIYRIIYRIYLSLRLRHFYTGIYVNVCF